MLTIQYVYPKSGLLYNINFDEIKYRSMSINLSSIIRMGQTNQFKGIYYITFCDGATYFVNEYTFKRITYDMKSYNL